ncbi:hypothetical protein PR202_ga06141 [Eleusine coracana subsp. coracana]|uniref:AB hydrolase-1 domain-containing protein n=1 Tax=Eleusine coracana subsp. coracana TaxID=191504 RepID=A0AAV5BVY2_ELECO|nr:hypothetical protein QOZ80_5AG0361160 [Eleusine coracana subsp. coracana]GJM89914.1 hypothetical protein PR202_ga06141 [Eleusine coracana subsp. coracana]
MRRWYCNVREVGSGDTTVVLAHGYGANQGLWDKLLPSLSHTNKVLLFDWDFATSSSAAGNDDDGQRYSFVRFAEDLIALMDEREVRGAVMVGHSMSAMAACVASVTRPDLFAHLVLLCASPRYINSEDGQEEEGYVGGFERPSIDGMLDAMSLDFEAWVRGFVPNAAGGDPDSVPHLEKSFLAMNPGVAHEVAKMIFLGDQREVLDAVTAPCTVVQVMADFAAPPCVAEYMKRRMVKASVVTVEIINSVGHFPQLVAPQQLLHILHAVLRRHQEAGSEEQEADGGGGIHVTA